MSWPDEVQRMISIAHEFSNVKLKKNLKACINNHKIVCGLTSHLKIHRRSKTFSEPYRVRTKSEFTSFFYTIGTFENIIHISFYIFENQKIVYTEPTLVLIPEYVKHGRCIMPTPQPLFSNYYLPYNLGGVKVSSPPMRPLS